MALEFIGSGGQTRPIKRETHVVKEKLVLQEDDQLREHRFREFLVQAKRIVRITCLATPALVGCMYLLMRDLPQDAFPKDFWVMACVLPCLPFFFLVAIYYPQYRFVHLKCVLSAKWICFSMPERRLFVWSALERVYIVDSSEHPGHFTIEFRGFKGRWLTRITVPNTYSREEIRVFIRRYAPAAGA